MSVGTLVTFRQADPETEYLPLATEGDFHKHWLPLAKSKNLRWFPLFGPGITLTREDIPAVLEEISLMRITIEAASLNSELKAHMLDRVRRLHSLLKDLDYENVEDVFIG